MSGKTFINLILRGKSGLNPAFRLVVYLGMLLSMLCVERAHAQSDGDSSFRLVFPASVFTAVNEADYRAAMKIWIRTVSEDLDILVDPEIYIQLTSTPLADFGHTHGMDCFGLLTPELAQLSREIPFDRIAVGITDGYLGEEYLLLVHGESGIQRLEQLKGETLNILNNPRMGLALTWLDIVLMEANLGLVSEFFNHVNLDTNTSQVVLPVFFRTRKACLVTRAGFMVMAELNPQLKQQLHVLAVSPILVANLIAFRSDKVSPFWARFLEVTEGLGESHAGHQILTLNQSESGEVLPISVMADSLALVEKHRQLSGLNSETSLYSHNTAVGTDRIGGIK